MTSLSDTALTGLVVLLMAATLFLASRFRRKRKPSPGESDLREMKRIAAAGGNRDQALLAAIEVLKRQLPPGKQ